MISKTDKLTPNVKRLLIEFMAKHQVDRVGADVGAIAADILAGGLGKSSEAALADLNAAIHALRTAPDGYNDPNPFRNATDEEIATGILDRLAERRRSRKV